MECYNVVIPEETLGPVAAFELATEIADDDAFDYNNASHNDSRELGI